MNRAVFLDRDGVINKRRPDSDNPIDWYVISWDQWEWADGAIEGLKLLAETDYKLIVVSNQACIGRGLITEDAIRGIFIKMKYEIEVAIRKALVYFYFCPHAPEDNCACRKPKPGMIYKAAVEHEIDLSRSWMVGDSESDMKAARIAGLYAFIKIDPARNPLDKYIVPNLLEAARLVVSRET